MISEERIQKLQIQDSIKQEMEQTLSVRTERYFKVNPHGIIPYTPFAPALAECPLLFRDGHFYSCIALVQAVAEAIARFLCEKNSWKPCKFFEENIKNLNTRKVISDDLKDAFLETWSKRDEYHHLNNTIETDKQILEEIAYTKILLLRKIESEVFKFSFTNKGELVPENKKYWELQEDGLIKVFLRLL
jgi:hypothetical protein